MAAHGVDAHVAQEFCTSAGANQNILKSNVCSLRIAREAPVKCLIRDGVVFRIGFQRGVASQFPQTYYTLRKSRSSIAH